MTQWDKVFLKALLLGGTWAALILVPLLWFNHKVTKECEAKGGMKVAQYCFRKDAVIK